MKKFAPHYSLDIDHVVVVGHSAGGQLALWAAARPHLPKSSLLWTSHPLAIHGVVSLAGIGDLQSYRVDGGFACGGAATIDGLIGAPARAHPYADTSPAALLPIGIRQAVVSGSLDAIVPPRFGHAYAAKATAAGDKVEDIEIANAGHFELIDPASGAWPKIVGAIAELSK